MSAAAFRLSEIDTQTVEPAPIVAQRTAIASRIASPRPVEHLTLKVVRDVAEFEQLEADWNSLFERAGASHQLFQSFNWLWHWCRHYLPHSTAGRRLHVVVGYRAGRMVMAWPLVAENHHGLTMLSWMGDPVSQYGDVVVDDLADREAVLDAGWEFVSKTAGADLVRLRKVRADAAIAPLLRRRQGLVTETLAAPFLDLGSARNFAAYEQRYSGSARRNRRRLARRLDEQGKIEFSELSSGPVARELSDLSIELKRKWLSARGLVSKAYADDRFSAFFGDVAEAALRPAGCRVAVLKSGGRPIAIETAIRCKDRIALHIIVFDLEFEKAGAGVLLLEQSLRNAADEGVACYDLLAPGDAYKLDWADGTVAVEDWALPLTLKGDVYARVMLQYVRNAGKKLMASLPAGPRRAAADLLSKLMSRRQAT